MIKKVLFIILFFPCTMFAQQVIYDPINTGVNMTVAIMSVDQQFSEGDTILALYNDHDTLKVGGLTIWQGNRLAIALWGDDSTSDRKDGFSNDEIIIWRVVKNDSLFDVYPQYRVGHNSWSANGISIMDSLIYQY